MEDRTFRRRLTNHRQIGILNFVTIEVCMRRGMPTLTEIARAQNMEYAEARAVVEVLVARGRLAKYPVWGGRHGFCYAIPARHQVPAHAAAEARP